MSMNRREVIKSALLSAGAISSGSAMAQQVGSRAGDSPKRSDLHQSYPAPPRRSQR